MTCIIFDLKRDISSWAMQQLSLEKLTSRHSLTAYEVQVITEVSKSDGRNYISCMQALSIISNGGTFANVPSQISWYTFDTMELLMKRLEGRLTPVEEYLCL